MTTTTQHQPLSAFPATFSTPARTTPGREKAKLKIASDRLRLAIANYLLCGEVKADLRTLRQAEEILTEQAEEFGKLTYNNPFATPYRADIQAAFYYYFLINPVDGYEGY